MPVEAIGTSIGCYKLLQQIGEGGMGIVYMAEQSQPISRRVALKIVKPGMDSKEVLARFEVERQALALMDHPNIAGVLDAGTTDHGRPYFVMELVKGVPITTFCDERKLSMKARLELFLPVCRAIHHAHQKGIIHRDIKPSNILVAQYDNCFVPKIIDFGLAKAFGQRLTEKTMFTQFGQIVGTIDYMSPEQASFNQLDIDTRSDIYSLGVLLYELLSGETPFDKKRLHSVSFDELLRIIRQEDPPRPSTRLSSLASLPAIAEKRRLEPRKLTLLVRGELDLIVMKSIDKERDQRYQSASGFADDVRRYLEGEDVLACPPSVSYRFHKFARRNRALLASATLVLGALLLGLAGTSWMLIRAIKAEEQAAEELRQKKYNNKRLEMMVQVQHHQVERSTQIERFTAELLDGMTKRIQQDSRLGSPDLLPLKRDLQEDAIQFWDRIIDTETTPQGKPNPRTIYYRIQRALALARFGSHKEAFFETQALQNNGGHVEQWLGEFCRICAVCAEVASNDPALSELYMDQGIEYFRQAAESAISKPPEETDPDFRLLRSHDDFETILQRWGENRSRLEAMKGR